MVSSAQQIAYFKASADKFKNENDASLNEIVAHVMSIAASDPDNAATAIQQIVSEYNANS
jgi:hypothetical protein